MKKNKLFFLFGLILAVNLLFFGGTFAYVKMQGESGESGAFSAQNQTKERIVTSFYPIYIEVANLIDGVEDLEVVNLSQPQTGCLHDYQLTPDDVKLLSTASLFVMNGSGAETFLDKVLAQYPDLRYLEATQGMEGDEEVLAHAFVSPILYSQEVETIAAYLVEAYPQDAAKIQENSDKYQAEIEALIDQTEELKTISSGRPVVLFHEAFTGLSEDLGLEEVLLVDMDEERQTSAGEVNQVLELSEKEEGLLLLADPTYGEDLIETIENNAEIPYAYLDTLTRGDYEDLSSYIDGQQENLDTLKRLLSE